MTIATGGRFRIGVPSLGPSHMRIDVQAELCGSRIAATAITKLWL